MCLFVAGALYAEMKYVQRMFGLVGECRLSNSLLALDHVVPPGRP